MHGPRRITLRRGAALVVATLTLAGSAAACGDDDAGTVATELPTTMGASPFPESLNPTLESSVIHVVSDPQLDDTAASTVEAFTQLARARGADVTSGTVGSSGTADQLLQAAIDAEVDALVLAGLGPDDFDDGLEPAVGARIAVFSLGGEPAIGLTSTFVLAPDTDPADAAATMLMTISDYFSGTIPDPVTEISD